ncbi:MAG: DUF3604 domain-containing protein [Halioglobus sp.]
MNTKKRATLLLALAVAASPAAQAEDKKYYAGAPSENATGVYFGDPHIHTVMSMDAAAWGTTQTPNDSYRYAKGEEVTSFKGWKTQLTRPLDFTVIADHSDGYDFYNMVKNGDPIILKEELGRSWNELLSEGGEENRRFVADDLIKRFGGGDEMPWDVSDPALLAPGWKTTVAAADKHNDPGNFTAFIGYEWSSAPGGDNLHRVVIYRDNGDKASQTLPLTMTETKDPEDLWKSLQAYEDKTGGKVMAIAHNGNWSSGQMFSGVRMNGKRLDETYAKNRMRWEPVYENTQIKGDGEAHPLLSPDDEFADFETWDVGNLSFSKGVTIEMLPGSYSRSALKLGLQHEAKIGVNPFQFGQIGAGDSHTGLPGQEENQFMGKSSSSEPDAERWETVFRTSSIGTQAGWSESAGGLTGIWATENTREVLWDALKRKEVYATTGTRIKVRMFGGWDFKPGDDQHSGYVALGYEKGVPMGGELHGDPQAAAVRKAYKTGKPSKSEAMGFLGYGVNAPGTAPVNDDGQDYRGIAAEVAKLQKSPTFLVAAMKDPMGGNLDRVQMVKGWRDSKGELHEKVYDIVWSDNRIQDPVTNKLPPVGNTVNIPDASWTNTIGDVQLSTVWQDPNFDGNESAFYYVRVLEIPTPRWTAYDAKRFGVEMGPEVPMTLQERAYTSPIWYKP